eukprot:80619-Pyramimonas_sp.AAC.1
MDAWVWLRRVASRSTPPACMSVRSMGMGAATPIIDEGSRAAAWAAPHALPTSTPCTYTHVAL